MANNSPVTCTWAFDFAAVAICYRGGFKEEVCHVAVKVERQEMAKDALMAEILKNGHRIISCKEMVCQTKDGKLGTFLFVVEAPVKKRTAEEKSSADASGERKLEAKLVGGEWR